MQARLDHHAVFLPGFGGVAGFEPGRFHGAEAGVGEIEFEIEFAPKIPHQRPDLGRRGVDDDPAAVAQVLDDDAFAPACLKGLGQGNVFVECQPADHRVFGNDIERVDGVTVEFRRDFHGRHDARVAIGFRLAADAEDAVLADDAEQAAAFLFFFSAAAEERAARNNGQRRQQ